MHITDNAKILIDLGEECFVIDATEEHVFHKNIYVDQEGQFNACLQRGSIIV